MHLPSRLLKLRQRFGIAAPRVAVRSEVAWYLRWVGLILVLGCSAALAAWMYDAGRRFAGFDRSEVEQQLADTRRALEAARSELERVRTVANVADSTLSIERSAQVKLTQQIRGMEQESARLREELAIFESMLSAEQRASNPLSINRFTVVPDVLPGEYRYRLLLLLAPGSRRERDFQGRLELVVSLTEGGKNATLTFSESGDPSASAFRLAFRHFHRVEGVFRVDPKAKVDSVQVRVYEGTSDQARAAQSASPG
ncbi:MAG: hypothetical protein O2979_08800 [Proteobacteria bacterium]|nr:hypothetical protein [Pseudomonadota bacterium]